VELSSRNGNVNTNLKLYENFGSMELEKGSPVHLLENKEVQSISVYVEDDSSAGKVLTVIQSMLLKVNHDVMGAGLISETYVENAVTKELVSLSEAQQQMLSPWFHSENQQETEKTYTQKSDLDSFLESLS